VLELNGELHQKQVTSGVVDQNSGGNLIYLSPGLRLTYDKWLSFVSVGVNQGDVFFDETRVYGDGVNVAARLEGIADPGGICISGKVYDEVNGKIEASLHDIGLQKLKNIAQPVRAYRVDLAPVACTSNSGPALTLPDKPSIAVLPFTNLSGEPKEDYFSDGITEDIITELSRFSELFVIARNSSFQYKGKSPDVRQVGREVGVRYVLEGSIRRAGERVRITAHLIDAATGMHLWAERYDRELKDVFAVQDDVTRNIVAVLPAHVNKAETERTLMKPPTIWRAYDYYLRATAILTSYLSSTKAEDLYNGRRLLEHALSIDPNYARCYSILSYTYVSSWINPFDTDHLNPTAIERALELARTAVLLDPNLPTGHSALGLVLAYQRDHDASIAAFEKAIMLNRNFMDWRFAMVLVFSGEFVRAIEVVQAYKRVDPFYPPPAAMWSGVAYYMLRRYDEALPHLKECAARAPNFRAIHVWLAATLAQLQRLEDARAEANTALRISPKFTASGTGKYVVPFKHPRDTAHYFDGLRKAGLPE
jgi:adenylate cyclase